MKLKIYFCDFWNGFDYNDNVFVHLLRYHYEVVVDEDPDILFFSCYGFNHLKYTCHKIFYTAENVLPDFRICDFSISFDWNTHQGRNMRLPLFRLNGSLEAIAIATPAALKSTAEKKFCCMVVSNPACKERNRFFEILSSYKKVDSGGKFKNNIGFSIPDKAAFIKDYKFVLSFENSLKNGYTTEKVLEPILAGSLPVYWGNPEIGKDFNERRIVNVHRYPSFEKAIEEIIRLDQDDEAYDKVSQLPVFPEHRLPDHLAWDQLATRLKEGLTRILHNKPVAILNPLYPRYNKYKRLMISRLTLKPHWYC